MRTISREIMESDAPKWILWWIGTLIFMAGLVAHIWFDQDSFTYPLTAFQFALLIFYFKEMANDQTRGRNKRVRYPEYLTLLIYLLFLSRK